jgi:hypothetical protein
VQYCTVCMYSMLYCSCVHVILYVHISIVALHVDILLCCTYRISNWRPNLKGPEYKIFWPRLFMDLLNMTPDFETKTTFLTFFKMKSTSQRGVGDGTDTASALLKTALSRH